LSIVASVCSRQMVYHKLYWYRPVIQHTVLGDQGACKQVYNDRKEII